MAPPSPLPLETAFAADACHTRLNVFWSRLGEILRLSLVSKGRRQTLVGHFEIASLKCVYKSYIHASISNKYVYHALAGWQNFIKEGVPYNTIIIWSMDILWYIMVHYGILWQSINHYHDVSLKGQFMNFWSVRCRCPPKRAVKPDGS